MTITVPYPWESRLSGLSAAEYKGAGWYEREFTVPAAWTGQRVYLHFGAVDWQARVWVNGKLVAEHENGYLPFAMITSRLISTHGIFTSTITHGRASISGAWCTRPIRVQPSTMWAGSLCRRRRR
jgi:beta-galactosidase/beta-glucuronidase